MLNETKSRLAGKKLTKKEQQAVKGGLSCYAQCRPFLDECPGIIAKSDCQIFMDCMNGCS